MVIFTGVGWDEPLIGGLSVEGGVLGDCDELNLMNLGRELFSSLQTPIPATSSKDRYVAGAAFRFGTVGLGMHAGGHADGRGDDRSAASTARRSWDASNSLTHTHG